MLVTTSNTFQIITFTNFRYLDKNYAGTLIIWDRMFGSFEPEQEEVVYGVQNQTNSPSHILGHSRSWNMESFSHPISPPIRNLHLYPFRIR